ncbi:MAG TPA: SpoIIE family protein phosphatase [Gaiellaceae bacterium]|jgi:serine phosphatase RsbU (regulator of sigma subunit)|nr:SpoIIE family protein phosphatase [Gaiellaceae bacterium]
MAVDARRAPFETLLEVASRVAAETDLRSALQALASCAAEAAGADLAVVRLPDPTGDLVARAVAPVGSAFAAEVAGSRAAPSTVGPDGVTEPTRRAAERARATLTVALPIVGGGRPPGCLELVRVGGELDADELAAAQFVAAEVALVVRALAEDGDGRGWSHRLELAGEALAAGGDAARAWLSAVRVVTEIAGGRSGLLWRVTGADLELAAAEGLVEGELDVARELAYEALAAPGALDLTARPALGAAISTVVLGRPPIGVLQLVHAEDAVPTATDLPALAAFAARATHALRAAGRADDLSSELDRTRALVEVVGEAISRLSLAHTLDTAVERIAELFRIGEVGVYLRDEGLLTAAAGRGLADGHEAVARELLAVALGPLRARTAVAVDVGSDEPVLAGVRTALANAGRPAAVGVPLHAHEETIGLLVAYPSRRLSEGDETLLASLGAQLAVAVQNARLHEQATQLGDALGGALASERQSARQLRALYEISRSFAQSLSLETTLEAVTKTIVDVLDVDAAVMRLPDERGDAFVPRVVHVADSRLAAAVRAILERPQPSPPRTSAPAMLDAAAAARVGGAHALLVPFLEKGSTAALLPITNGSELLAQLTILSLDPAAPIDDETLDTAGTIARQAALAIDNARLYQQQKAFAETMQQSLLPRERPDVPGLDVGTVYESAAQVDVGGDVFDFLELGDGRLAVVLGDVTGHGIDATADMAMAKFVFRSLAREHSEPSAFLAHANDVVVGEIAVGKFITMAYLLVGPGGDLLCAGAGHPAPRLVRPDGAVESLECGGLALGIDAPQTYEQVHAHLEPGAAVVLYTDGVIEARRERELFGTERLDAVLAEGHTLSAQALADAVVAACRGFSGGDLGDDCAIVVIKRAA